MLQPTDAVPTPPPDPGSPALARWTWVLLVVLLGVSVVLQQWPASGRREAAATPAQAAQRDGPWPAVERTPLGRLALRLMPSRGSFGAANTVGLLESFARSELDALRLVMIERAVRGPGAETVRLAALTERLRAALAGPAPGADPDERGALGPAARPLRPEARLLAEAELLRRAFTSGPASLTQPERDGLVERHGPLGRLVITDDQPDLPERAALLEGGPNLLAWGFLALAAVALAVVVGTVLLVLGVVRARSGELPLRLVAPAPGGSVLLETVVVFIAGFIVLRLSLPLLVPALGGWKGWPWVLQWLLVATTLWPLVRGVPLARWREMVGLTWARPGSGLLREIGCGLVGYLAVLPLFALGTAVNLLVLRGIASAGGGGDGGGAGAPVPPPTPENPLVDIVGGLSGVELALFVLLAVVWAPLVEEVVFRGGMFRHLRARAGLALSAVVTAVVFGLLHGYAWYLLTPVIMLGLGFALLRQWRGSLVACITAHAIHNGIVTGVMVLAFSRA
jgi:membrane protease YdiL (CAAX protease family)